MVFWILIAVAALIVSAVGLWVLVSLCRQGRLNRNEVGLLAGSYLLLVAIVLGGEAARQPVISELGGSALFFVLIPVWLLVLQRARERDTR